MLLWFLLWFWAADWCLTSISKSTACTYAVKYCYPCGISGVMSSASNRGLASILDKLSSISSLPAQSALILWLLWPIQSHVFLPLPHPRCTVNPWQNPSEPNPSPWSQQRTKSQSHIRLGVKAIGLLPLCWYWSSFPSILSLVTMQHPSICTVTAAFRKDQPLAATTMLQDQIGEQSQKWAPQSSENLWRMPRQPVFRLPTLT